jgi:hypothetical protein
MKGLEDRLESLRGKEWNVRNREEAIVPSSSRHKLGEVEEKFQAE